MDALAVEEARQRLARWLEDGRSVLGVVPWLFEENERLRAAADAADRECARLRQELEALRAETNFLIDERGEIAELIAEGLNKVMNDALRRLRTPLDMRRAAATTSAVFSEAAVSLSPEPTYS
jgi:ElaB/YqjD/DUF883 family membrane-anchored ribosome-binding protein